MHIEFNITMCEHILQQAPNIILCARDIRRDSHVIEFTILIRKLKYVVDMLI